MTKPTSPNKIPMPESHSAPPVAETVQRKLGPGLSSIALALVIVVSLFCCALMLLAPTRSLATNPVYKGF